MTVRARALLAILTLMILGIAATAALAHDPAPTSTETSAADDGAVTTTGSTEAKPEPRIGFWAADGTYYPISTCPISGEPVNHNPAKLAKFDLDGRTVYTCCGHCEETVIEDPAKYNQVLDELVIAQQSADYPIKTCPISGEELGEMGEPVKFVINNYLVEVCCAGCEAGVRANPDKVLGELKAFWSAPKPAVTVEATKAE